MISVLPLCPFHLYIATLKQQSAYGVYISQLIGYSSVCGSVFRYLDFLDGELQLPKEVTVPKVPIGNVDSYGISVS